MSNLMNHYTNKESFLSKCVGAAAVLLQRRARAIEGNHRIFHAADKADIDGLRGRIGIIK